MGRGAQEACPGGVTPAETWTSGSGQAGPRGDATGPGGGCHKPRGCRAGSPPRALPGAPAARRARVFVSLLLSEASPTPERGSLFDPRLTRRLPQGFVSSGSPPPGRAGAAAAPGPRPLPARSRGQRQRRHVAAERHRLGRERRGRARWKPRAQPESGAGSRPAPAPRPPRARRPRPPSRLRPAPAPSRGRAPLPRPPLGEVGPGPGGEGTRAGGPRRAGSPVLRPAGRGGEGARPNFQSSGRPPPRPWEEGRLPAAPAPRGGLGPGRGWGGERAGGGAAARMGVGAAGGGRRGVNRGPGQLPRRTPCWGTRASGGPPRAPPSPGSAPSCGR